MKRLLQLNFILRYWQTDTISSYINCSPNSICFKNPTLKTLFLWQSHTPHAIFRTYGLPENSMQNSICIYFTNSLNYCSGHFKLFFGKVIQYLRESLHLDQRLACIPWCSLLLCPSKLLDGVFKTKYLKWMPLSWQCSFPWDIWALKLK